MKKIIIISNILLTFLLVGLVFADNKNDWMRGGLKGKVKKITHLFYRVESNKIPKQWAIKHICKYNKQGNVIEDARYKSDNSLIYRNIVKYDIDGNRIESKKYGPDGKLIVKFEYEYDKKGHTIAEDFRVVVAFFKLFKSRIPA